jgi:hypothetical protein
LNVVLGYGEESVSFRFTKTQSPKPILVFPRITPYFFACDGCTSVKCGPRLTERIQAFAQDGSLHTRSIASHGAKSMSLWRNRLAS